MTTKYFLAPNARWQGRNQTGQPAIGGKLYTYVNQTSTPKTTYQDKNGSVPNTNPVTLDGKGEANIYWASDDLYTIALFDSAGNEIYTQDNYPYVDSDGTVTPSVTTVTNLIRNPQFSWWNNTTSFSPVNNSVNANDYVADDWIFQRNNTSSTIEISRATFTPDNTDVPGTPIYYLHYDASASGSGETYRRLSQSFQGVRSLAGQTVAVSFYAKRGSTPVNLAVNLRQYFGSGGSSEVSTAAIGQTPLTESWARYTNSVTLPSVSGKTIGTGDALFFDFAFDPNTSGVIDICNVQFQVGTEIEDFPYQTVDEQFKRLDATVNEAVFTTGDFKQTLATSAPAGWVLCNDGTIGNPASGANTALVRCKALFSLIYAGVTNTYAPIYNSDGTVGTRTTVEADWNANKRLSLTKALGRALAAANTVPTPIVLKVFTASADNGHLKITVDDATSFYSGTKIRVSNSGGALPTGLSAGTDYYCIYASTTTFFLSTTLSGAVDGANEFFGGGAPAITTAIPFLDAGTGTNSIFTQNTAHPFGSYLGEDIHSNTIPENAAHVHGELDGHEFARTGGTTIANAGSELGSSATTAASGNSQPHNNIQPTTYVNIMLKL